jgi:hypothetical protein
MRVIRNDILRRCTARGATPGGEAACPMMEQKKGISRPRPILKKPYATGTSRVAGDRIQLSRI